MLQNVKIMSSMRASKFDEFCKILSTVNYETWIWNIRALGIAKINFINFLFKINFKVLNKNLPFPDESVQIWSLDFFSTAAIFGLSRAFYTNILYSYSTFNSSRDSTLFEHSAESISIILLNFSILPSSKWSNVSERLSHSVYSSCSV